MQDVPQVDESAQHGARDLADDGFRQAPHLLQNEIQAAAVHAFHADGDVAVGKESTIVTDNVRGVALMQDLRRRTGQLDNDEPHPLTKDLDVTVEN